MSAMTFGSPDFLSYPSWTTPDLLGAPPAGYPVGITAGTILPISHYGAVMVRFQPTAGQGHVTLTFTEDQGGTIGDGADSWPVNSGTGLFVTMPAEGPFVQLNVTNTGAVNLVGTFRLRLCNMTPGRPSYPITDDVAGGLGISIPASGFQRYPMGLIHSGAAAMVVAPHDAAGKVNYQVFTEDESGTALRLLSDFIGPTGVVSDRFPAVDTIMAVHVTNTDAAGAHVFDLAFWAQPY